jgi:hypothetical protein
MEVAVDGSPAGGVTFTLDPDSAVPAPDDADGRRVTWSFDSDGNGDHSFLLTYDSNLGASGAADAIPSVVIRLTPGLSGSAAEHLRGEIPVPGVVQVHRVGELVYAARVAAPSGAPRLDAGATYGPFVGPGRAGLGLSHTHQLTAMGDAPPGAFEDSSVTAEFKRSGFPYGISRSWSYAGNANVRAEVGETFVWDEEPPWYRLSSTLGFKGGPSPGLEDGMGTKAVFLTSVETDPSFYSPDDPRQPRNDNGALSFDWDGSVIDEVGLSESYGSLAREDEVLRRSFGWVDSMWNVQSRVTGGDIDRRGVVSDPLAAEPDGSFHLEPPRDWRISLVFITGGPPNTTSEGSFNEDGSFTYGLRVEDGKYLLESEVGEDGFSTWSWQMSFLTSADPAEDPLNSRVGRVVTLVVPEEQSRQVVAFIRGGGSDQLVLGPGTHFLNVGPDGSIRVVRTLASSSS